MTSPFTGPRSARQAQEIVTIDNPAAEANSVLPADPEASSNAEAKINDPTPEFQPGPPSMHRSPKRCWHAPGPARSARTRSGQRDQRREEPGGADEIPVACAKMRSAYRRDLKTLIQTSRSEAPAFVRRRASAPAPAKPRLARDARLSSGQTVGGGWRSRLVHPFRA